MEPVGQARFGESSARLQAPARFEGCAVNLGHL